MVRGIFVDNLINQAELKGVDAEICQNNAFVPAANRIKATNFVPDPALKRSMALAYRAGVGILSSFSVFLNHVLFPLLMAPPTRWWRFSIAFVCFLAFLLFFLIRKSWWVFFPIPIPPIFAPLAHSGGWIALILAPISFFSFINSFIPLPVLMSLIRHPKRPVLDERDCSICCFSIENAHGLTFNDISAGGGFFCASVIGILKKWKIDERAADLIPPWGQTLLKEGGKYAVSTGIDGQRGFTAVSDWDMKLTAVQGQLGRPGAIEVLVCSLEDWETVKQVWSNLTERRLKDRTDWFSRCRYDKNLGITFLACHNVNAFQRYLSPHRLRWLVLRLLAVIGFGFVLLSGTYPPTPEFAVDFFPQVFLYSPPNATPEAPLVIKMSPGDELAVFIQVITPLSQSPFQVHVEADSESLWTELPWLVAPNPKKEVVLTLINSKMNLEVEKVNFKMPSARPSGWPLLEVTVTIRVSDSYGQDSEKRYRFLSQ